MTEITSPSEPAPRTLARILGLFAPHRKRVVLLAATILAGAIAGVGAPLLTKSIFDDALFPSTGEPNLGLSWPWSAS